MSKKILVVGNGAREHAICKALKKSPQIPKIYVFMTANNPGISELAEEIQIADSLLNFEALKEFAQKIQPDFAIVGPDDPIGAGAVDALLAVGIKSMAPKKSLARLESSKSFTRNLLKKYNIVGNPDFQVFTSTEGMQEYAEKLGEIVVKYDGLLGGKGVKVQGDHFDTIEEGLEFARECLEDSDRVIVEEKFVGQEFSAMFFVDGNTIVAMPLVQDNKRAYEDDKGPNTGGMGTVSDDDHNLPFLIAKDVEEAKEITWQVMQALEKECGEKYHGIMYGGFIATANGVRLIEYNARFGDPEAMNVLPILESDFVEVCEAIINEKLADIEVKFAKKATVCKYVVPEGYPDAPVKGVEIELDLAQVPAGVEINYASVSKEGEKLLLKGSRAIAFTGIADSIEEAEQLAEKAVNAVKGPIFHRKDIGTKALLDKRAEQMKNLRS